MSFKSPLRQRAAEQQNTNTQLVYKHSDLIGFIHDAECIKLSHGLDLDKVTRFDTLMSEWSKMQLFAYSRLFGHVSLSDALEAIVSDALMCLADDMPDEGLIHRWARLSVSPAQQRGIAAALEARQ